MVVAYPSTLPQLAQQNYSEGLPNNVLIEDMDSGPPQTRLRNSSPVAPVSFTWTLDATERAALKSFYETDLAFGSQTFQHLDFGGVGTTHHYLFVAAPQFTHLGGNVWSCQIQLMKVATV